MRSLFLVFLFTLSALTTPVKARKPVITGQKSLTMQQGSSLTVGLTDIYVTDEEGNDYANYPSGFSLEVFNGKNYSVSGNTITPSSNFYGNLEVPIRVEEGNEKSKKFDLSITVLKKENEPPVITGQQSISVDQGSSFTIQLGHLFVNDPDNTYPDGFAVQVYDGVNYTRSGNTIIPAEGFFGSLIVPVTVNDGTSESQRFDFQITVNQVIRNQKPVITGQQSLSTNENTPITIALSHLTVSDPDNSYPSGFTLQLVNGANYSVSGTTVTPASGFTGTLTVPVTVNDGTDTSDPFNLSITVNRVVVNQKPVITGQQALSINNTQSITIQLSHLTVTDPDNNYPADFTLKVFGGDNYTVSGNTITPSPGFTGILTVGVAVNDGQLDSDVFGLKITVNAIQTNTAPVITGQRTISVRRNQSYTLVLADLQVTDPDNVYPDDFTLKVMSGENYTLSGSVITPRADFVGVLVVPVTVSDDKAESGVFNVRITVEPEAANVAPVITGQVALSIQEGTQLLIELTHLRVTDPDNTYPDDFTLKVYPGNNYTVTGRTIRPVDNFSGTLSVVVTVNDGRSESNPFALAVTVTPKQTNQRPVITGQAGVSTLKDTPITLTLQQLTVNDPDSNYPADFSLQVLPGANYTVNGTTITPASGFTGTLSVQVTVNDGELTSAPFTMRIDVIDVAQLEIIGQRELRTKEDSVITIVLTDLVVNDPDGRYPNGFTLQIDGGERYRLSGTTITPERDYFGNLEIPVRVTNGSKTSSTFTLLVIVEPVNDAPVITGIENQALTYADVFGDIAVAPQLVIADVDNDNLFLAEIGIRAETFQRNIDQLSIGTSTTIRVVNDVNAGVLYLVGEAPVEEYQTLLRSVRYQFLGADSVAPVSPKAIYFEVNDGRLSSERRERIINFADEIGLDIPTVFTPNNDNANDLWRIRPLRDTDGFNNTTVRVYNKRGFLVYETQGVSNAWDGRVNGTLVPADTYYYTVEVDFPGNRRSYKGTLTVLY